MLLLWCSPPSAADSNTPSCIPGGFTCQDVAVPCLPHLVSVRVKHAAVVGLAHCSV